MHRKGLREFLLEAKTSRVLTRGGGGVLRQEHCFL